MNARNSDIGFGLQACVVVAIAGCGSGTISKLV